MKHLRSFAFAVACAVFLSACGVDTTGISAASSKTPTGPAGASVLVTEYGDFQCPACGSAYIVINKPFLAKYGDKVRMEFKNFPLRSIHENAFEAAQAGECAADQGRFWEFVDMDYINQAQLSPAKLREWAAALKLDTALFERCVSSGIKGDVIMAEEAAGEKLGVKGTPSYFVNGVRVPENSIEALTAAVDAALKNAKSVPL